HALDHHVERLADDHALARRLAEGLQGLPGLRVKTPETNIVFLELDQPAPGEGAQLLAHLRQHGVLATGMVGLRFVTHLDVSAVGIDRAIAAVCAYTPRALA
ncbi:MAG: hypothetical protein RLZZ584_3364, partial [Pseudomonadota bacterium]